jgi:hypothetical protein
LEEQIISIFSFKDKANEETSMEHNLLPASCWFLLGFIFSPEDGSDLFLRNLSLLSQDYMVLYPRS